MSEGRAKIEVSKKEALMLKGLAINPFINSTSTLAQVEAELEVSLNRAEALDWDITEEDERGLIFLTNLARAKGSKREW
jgi:hypothetical protein